jgi:hypothetical protein
MLWIQKEDIGYQLYSLYQFLITKMAIMLSQAM